MGKVKYVAKVTPDKDGGFVGEVVDKKTGKPAGLSSRTRTAEQAADDALYFTDSMNRRARG